MEEYISDNSVYARAKSNSMINPKMIGRVLGTLLFIELGMFLLCAGISLGYGEDDYKYFLYTCVINAVAGGLLLLYGRILCRHSFMDILYRFRDASFLFQREH